MLAVTELYEDVLIQLVAAVGAALFLANAYALARRRRDAEREAGGEAAGRNDGNLTKAPVARTVTFMLVGFVVMIWGVASLLR